ncbi:hypothetical protein BH09PAT4_BH09PAT4_06750 [soil metagenome]
MKQAKFNLAVFLVSLCALLVLAASPVLAQDGSSGDTNDDSTTSSEQSTTSEDNSGSTETEDESETESEVHAQAESFRKEGERKLELRREAKNQTKSKLQRVKTCKNIQRAVNNKLKAFSNNADKHLTRLNALFNRLKSYQAANNLSGSNYDALLATATQEQSDASLAVHALTSLGTTVNCSASDPAAMLSSVKTGAADARNALKDYRAALKAIVVALVQASKTETTTEGN